MIQHHHQHHKFIQQQYLLLQINVKFHSLVLLPLTIAVYQLSVKLQLVVMTLLTMYVLDLIFNHTKHVYLLLQLPLVTVIQMLVRVRKVKNVRQIVIVK